jgi:hypothetical protein
MWSQSGGRNRYQLSSAKIFYNWRRTSLCPKPGRETLYCKDSDSQGLIRYTKNSDVETPSTKRRKNCRFVEQIWEYSSFLIIANMKVT